MRGRGRGVRVALDRVTGLGDLELVRDAAAGALLDDVRELVRDQRLAGSVPGEYSPWLKTMSPPTV